MSQVLPRGDRWAMAGLVLGCVLFGLGSLIIVFVPLGSFAMSFWRLLVGALAFALLAFDKKKHYGLQEANIKK